MLTPYEQIVRQAAQRAGVNPDVFVSLWEQESGRSTDLGLRGTTLPEGHKYAGHYARGPFQIMSFHGDIPNTFEGQADWAAQHVADRGLAGYYGTGKPPPGFPTTDQYVAQVMNRATRTDTPQGLFAEAPTMAGQQPMAPMQPPMQAPMQQPPGFFDRLTGSPAFNMGLGILASNQGNYGAWGPAIGRGAMLGMQNLGSMQEGQTLAQVRQMQMEEAQRKRLKDEQDAQYVEQWVASLPEKQRMMARVLGPDKLADYLIRAEAGPEKTATEREIERAMTDPAFAEKWKEMKAAGATQINMPTDSLGLKPKDRFEMERQMENDYRERSKPFDMVLGAAGRWDAAKKAGGGVGDMAAITAFAKMLDPESVVREAEFNAAINTASTVERFKLMIQKLKTGEMLSPEQRNEMGKVIDALRETAVTKKLSNYMATRDRVKDYGLDPFRATGIRGAWEIMGYKTEQDAIKDAREALKVNPGARDIILQRLDSMGISGEALN